MCATLSTMRLILKRQIENSKIDTRMYDSVLLNAGQNRSFIAVQFGSYSQNTASLNSVMVSIFNKTHIKTRFLLTSGSNYDKLIGRRTSRSKVINNIREKDPRLSTEDWDFAAYIRGNSIFAVLAGKAEHYKFR